LVLIDRLFEILVDFGVLDVRPILALFLKINLCKDAGFLEFKLALYLRRVANPMRLRFFSDGQQLPHLLCKILARSLISREARTHLWWLVFGDHLHVCGSKLDRTRLSCLDLPEDQTC